MDIIQFKNNHYTKYFTWLFKWRLVLLYSLNKFTKNIDELKKTFQNKKTGVIDKFFEIHIKKYVRG